MRTLIRAEGLSIGYKTRRKVRKTIAADLSLDLKAGDLVCLVGPNGCGKSTLLWTITGLLPPLSGEVYLGGRDVRALAPLERAKLVSVVLTNPVQAGQLSVYDVCGLGRYPYTGWLGSLTDIDRRQVEQALDAVGVASFADRFLDELSDGERQKVMIARALAQNSRLMILDEPTAYLDVPYRMEIMHILRSLARNEDRGILLSTHDLDLAMRTADHLWAISREGRFYCGAPEDLALDGVISEVFGIGGINYDVGCGCRPLREGPSRYRERTGRSGSGRSVRCSGSGLSPGQATIRPSGLRSGRPKPARCGRCVPGKMRDASPV